MIGCGILNKLFPKPAEEWGLPFSAGFLLWDAHRKDGSCIDCQTDEKEIPQTECVIKEALHGS